MAPQGDDPARPSGDHEDPQPLSNKQVDAFLGTLRRSAEIAQDLLRTTQQQVERIRSLENDLDSARKRIAVLENETSRLRGSLGPGALDSAQQAQLEELVEEQNCLAHLFITSDRLARVESVPTALQVAVEVLHNLVGARHFGLYFRFAPDGEPLMLAPSEPSYRRALGQHRELVARALADQRATAALVSAPVCLPLRLEGAAVGALLITEFVPQVGNLGRLQQDLLSLLAERLASSMCHGFLYSEGNKDNPWARLRQTVRPLDEGQP